jgi:ribose transport system substrate-binding protein
MKYQKWIIDALIVIFFSTLFILWHSNYNRGIVSSSSELNKFYKIYLITTDNKDQYWQFINQGATDMAALLGVSYKWNAPETKNTDKQIEILNSAVDDGADAILIAVNDPVKTSSAIEDAKARNVKIIYVDTPAYEEAITTLSTDNYHAGEKAGEQMIAELEEKGIKEGRLGIIGVNKATDSTMKREEGFRNYIEKDGRFMIAPTEYENGDPTASQNAAAGLIKQYNDLVGIFGTNEGSSIGAGNAIKADHNRIIGIGFDKSNVTLDLIRSDSLQAIVVQNPYTMGYLGMAEAVAALKGLDTGPKYLDTGVTVLIKR